ncbi:MAG: hypothetical protein RSE41_10120 [Clostridia bacterium]
MYDINTKNVKKGKNPYFIFLVAGLLFFVIVSRILVSNHLKLKSLASNILSTRIEINSHYNDEGVLLYSPIYHYTVNGANYACSSNTSSNVNPGTANKIVYYDSKNPSNCMTEYSKSSDVVLLVFMIMPVILIVIAVVNMRKISKRVRLINDLNQKGKLIKNLQYRLENTNISVNNAQIQRIVVDYTLPSGSNITLCGDPRHDRRLSDTDGMVDLVIDENNPDNYFIDFEINRINGNLPTDYYNSNVNINSNNSNQF